MNGPAPTPVAQAVAAQYTASDPAATVFVSASAGSGKTKLLIDRLLRLMLPRREAGTGRVLAGAVPTRILCLTYTKAAAAEMAIRLNKVLGVWVTLDDAPLDARLRELDALTGPEGRAAARALFAKVLDLPGGMRIQTIHAFCQSLLRRFPLEAAISPHFRLIDAAESQRTLHAALDGAVLDDLAGVSDLATLSDLPGFRALIGTLRTAGRRLNHAFVLQGRGEGVFNAALSRALELAAGDLQTLQTAAVSPPDEAGLVAALRLVADGGSPTLKTKSLEVLDILANPAALRDWDSYRRHWLTVEMVPRASSGLMNANFGKAHLGLAETLNAEAARVAQAHATLVAADAVRLTALLLAIGEPALAGHLQAKQGVGAVEFDDLISRTLDLLVEPGAAWVLFKLDGGLDHVLLDEVQDTSPLQWQIAGALTEEFYSGRGQHDDAPARTVFAVGDFKQSIFGFQGARPEAFHNWRQRYRQRVADSGGVWRNPELVVSFRSAQTVLDLVDRVFADPVAADGVAEAGSGKIAHLAARPAQPGRIELWPLAVPPEDSGSEADEPWRAPGVNARQIAPVEQLAGALAERIATRIGTPRADGQPLAAGDILVLVRRRTSFNRLLSRELKARGVAVTNLLSAGLLERPAVQDLLALCDALLLPQDDLSLACVLTSPLGGLTDASMMMLAMERDAGETLWMALRRRAAERPDWQAARAFLEGLFSRVDLDSPYVLLSEALFVRGGRARLLARLGPESAEAIDEMLAVALDWAASHPPSLQVFVHWLRESRVETRTEPDAAGGAVRLMTVHGSKGLEAPWVILADTVTLPDNRDSNFVWTTATQAPSGWDADAPTSAERELPLWMPAGAYRFPAGKALGDKVREEALREYNRLLYVALTRAADEVLVCGWQGRRKVEPRSWYARVQAAFEATPGVVRAEFGPWAGEALCLADAAWPDTAKAPPVPDGPTAPAAHPAWMGRAPKWEPGPVPVEPVVPQPLAPSRPTDVAFGPAPNAESPLVLTRKISVPSPGRTDARRRGTVLHALLQYLPDLPAGQRRAAALAWLAGPGLELGDDGVSLVDEALRLIAEPKLAALFGPQSRAEQALAGRVGDLVISGQVDRLAITPEMVIVADFKSGRLPPERLDQVPVAYLRQMAAYRALLRAIYPDRRVVCVLVWTAGPEVMVLPDAFLDAHGLHLAHNAD